MLTNYKINPNVTHETLISRGFRMANDMYMKHIPIMFYKTRTYKMPTLYLQLTLDIENNWLNYAVLDDEYNPYCTYNQEFGDEKFSRKIDKIIKRVFEKYVKDNILAKKERKRRKWIKY